MRKQTISPNNKKKKLTLLANTPPNPGLTFHKTDEKHDVIDSIYIKTEKDEYNGTIRVNLRLFIS